MTETPEQYMADLVASFAPLTEQERGDVSAIIRPAWKATRPMPVPRRTHRPVAAQRAA